MPVTLLPSPPPVTAPQAADEVIQWISILAAIVGTVETARLLKAILRDLASLEPDGSLH